MNVQYIQFTHLLQKLVSLRSVCSTTALVTRSVFPTAARAGNREQKAEERLERAEEDRRRTRLPKQLVQRTAGRLQRPAESAESGHRGAGRSQGGGHHSAHADSQHCAASGEERPLGKEASGFFSGVANMCDCEWKEMGKCFVSS